MAWEEVPQTRVRDAAPCKVSLSVITGGTVRLFVSVSAATAAALSWEAGDHVGLKVGTGAHQGAVRVAPRSSGGAALRRVGKTGTLCVWLQPGEFLSAHQAPSRVAEHQVVDGALIITLPPEWELPWPGQEREAA